MHSGAALRPLEGVDELHPQHRLGTGSLGDLCSPAVNCPLAVIDAVAALPMCRALAAPRAAHT